MGLSDVKGNIFKCCFRGNRTLSRYFRASPHLPPHPPLHHQHMVTIIGMIRLEHSYTFYFDALFISIFCIQFVLKLERVYYSKLLSCYFQSFSFCMCFVCFEPLRRCLVLCLQGRKAQWWDLSQIIFSRTQI